MTAIKLKTTDFEVVWVSIIEHKEPISGLALVNDEYLYFNLIKQQIKSEVRIRSFGFYSPSEEDLAKIIKEWELFDRRYGPYTKAMNNPCTQQYYEENEIMVEQNLGILPRIVSEGKLVAYFIERKRKRTKWQT